MLFSTGRLPAQKQGLQGWFVFIEFCSKASEMLIITERSVMQMVMSAQR